MLPVLHWGTSVVHGSVNISFRSDPDARIRKPELRIRILEAKAITDPDQDPGGQLITDPPDPDPQH
jgi:hypothetical protein